MDKKQRKILTWIFAVVCGGIVLLIYFLQSGARERFESKFWSETKRIEHHRGKETKFHWYVDHAAGELYVKIETNAFDGSVGYFGIGFSPTGGMKGSDIFMVYKEAETDGIKYGDFHATGYFSPVRDKKNDYELLEDGFQLNDGYFKFAFKRKLDTCDDEDVVISDDTVRLIWGYNTDHPVYHDKDGEPILRKHTERGYHSIYIINRGSVVEFPGTESSEGYSEKGIKSWSAGVDNFTVPIQETLYYCRLFKFPGSGKKVHLVGFKANIPEENRKYVHHLTLLSCHIPKTESGRPRYELFEDTLSHKGGACTGDEVPLEWKTLCHNIIFPTGIGFEGYMFPEDVGLVLGEVGEPMFVKLELHYDNMNQVQIIDSSKLTIYYTYELRKHDAGMFFLGHKVTPYQMIPPGLKNFTIYSFCPAGCLDMALPSEGIKPISVLLHAHAYAVKMKLRHIRGNVELPNLAKDNAYDFSYQQQRDVITAERILPGDHLLTECEYDTSKNSAYVIGGLPSLREMCQALLIYYPKTILTDCRSQLELRSFHEPLGVEHLENGPFINITTKPFNIPKNKPMKTSDWDKIYLDDSYQMLIKLNKYGEIGDSPWKDVQAYTDDGKILSFHDHFMSQDWKNSSYTKSIQEAWRNNYHYSFCVHDALRIPTEEFSTKYPVFTPIPERKRKSCA